MTCHVTCLSQWNCSILIFDLNDKMNNWSAFIPYSHSLIYITLTFSLLVLQLYHQFTNLQHGPWWNAEHRSEIWAIWKRNKIVAWLLGPDSTVILMFRLDVISVKLEHQFSFRNKTHQNLVKVDKSKNNLSIVILWQKYHKVCLVSALKRSLCFISQNHFVHFTHGLIPQIFLKIKKTISHGKDQKNCECVI